MRRKIAGYILYHPSADPSMMLVTAPMNVEFVVTDPLGRRTGFDPTTGTTYAEIPGASYAEQSINTPGDPGYIPQTLVDERYFSSSSDVVDGAYQIQVFSVTGGSYYLDTKSYDSIGTLNDSNYRTGTLSAGKSATISLTHSSASVPNPNATFNLEHYTVKKHRNSDTQAKIEITGQITPSPGAKLALNSSFQFGIGGVTGYNLSVPASKFKVTTIEEHRVKRTSYFYRHDKTQIFLSDSGELKIEVEGANLSSLDSSQYDYLQVDIDSVGASVRAALSCSRNICTLDGRRHDCDDRKDNDGHGHRGRR